MTQPENDLAALAKAWVDASMTYAKASEHGVEPDAAEATMNSAEAAFMQALAAKDAEIARLTPSQGFVLVPVEPTTEMTGAGEDADGSAVKLRCGCETCDAAMHEFYSNIYRAMLAAAPPHDARA